MNDTPIDLTPYAGLPVQLDRATGMLDFGRGVVSTPPGRRTRADLRSVLRSPDASGGPDLAYHLYRDVRRARDEGLLASAGLRYDLTVTLPGAYGDEYVKTAGHYHPAGADGVSFPEIYEVLHGRAAFVLQHVDDVTAPRPDVRALWVQVCEPGERVVIPPDCGHVTVNVGDDPLVVADLISRECGHLYGSFAERRGAAGYVLVDGDNDPPFRVAPNPAYRDTPDPVVACGSRSHPVLPERGPVYGHVAQAPDELAFLTRPAEHVDALFAPWSR